MNKHLFGRCARVSAGSRPALPASNSGLVLTVAFCILLAGAGVFAQRPPSPESVLGFRPTDDRTIADWKQITGYFRLLGRSSPRVRVREIGKTTQGRSQIAAFISSAENIRNLKKIRELSRDIADPRTAGDKELYDRAFAEGKTVVAISCSIHSTEIVASQMSMLLAYDLAVAEDPVTRKILDDTVLILIPSANPDGIDIVANWYRKTLGTKYEGSSPPELYHHYAGHDNNRDWFMLNLVETRNITKLFWQDWFPQVVYDVHQQGRTGARMTLPPFFDPPNPRISPVILRELGLIGYKMAADLQASGQPGIVTNATYDTWWHGGFRSAPYYHNAIGILSEAASARLMSPVTITKEQLKRQRPARGLRSPLSRATNNPDVWAGGIWGPRDIARVEILAARSVLEIASAFRTRYLKNMIGLARANLKAVESGPAVFVIDKEQARPDAAARLIEILLWQGIRVERATKDIEPAAETGGDGSTAGIGAGSFIVRVAQPQKNNVLSLFEKQVYPKRVNADGEAEVPYDVAGWTLPLQMGVGFRPLENGDLFEALRGRLKPVTDYKKVYRQFGLRKPKRGFSRFANPLRSRQRIGLYKSRIPSMDEGWTRLVLDGYSIPYRSVTDREIREGTFGSDVVVLPSMSSRAILNGLTPDRYPEELTGGITEKGRENLKKFVSDGGTLVCFDDSCELLIESFDLPVKNVLKGLNRKQFHCPGSIVRLDLEESSPLTRGFGKQTAAYFIYSSAFEISDPTRVRSIARYADKDLLVSGWILGEDRIKGKTAVAETRFGNGRIILFAFRPQHRGQTFATFPLIFNALERPAARIDIAKRVGID